VDYQGPIESLHKLKGYNASTQQTTKFGV